MASKAGNLQMVRFLVASNCVLTERDNINRTPLAWSVKANHFSVFSELVLKPEVITPKEGNNNALHHLVQYSRAWVRDLFDAVPEQVFRLMQSSRNAEGMTPLMMAVTKPSRGYICKALLICSPNLEVKSTQGLTALEYLLAEEEHKEELLAAFKVLPNFHTLADAQGNTLLHLAARKGLRGLARLLLSKGADVNSLNADGNSPLFLAKSQSIVDLMVEEQKKRILSDCRKRMSSELKRECNICMEASDESFALWPCGHASFCARCQQRAAKKGQPCPICRTVIKRARKIYL